MSGIRNHEVQFSLKDQLFNKGKVKKIASEIASVYPSFEQAAFEKLVVEKFPELELMERIMWIRDALKEHLPQEYRTAVKVLLDSLPPELDPTQTDNDFGDFIYAPYGYFVSAYGTKKVDVPFSLTALETMTKRFSMEGPIRAFLNEHPKETLRVVTAWSKSDNYHVRRLASEGTRPFLPWASKIGVDPAVLVPVLDTLHSDSTRYVTRSVANHLNDLSKIDSALVTETLKKWKKLNTQTEKELMFIIKHSLRTLVKQGNKDALMSLGFKEPKVQVEGFTVSPKRIAVGEAVTMKADIISNANDLQNIVVDYIIHFQKANGTKAPKVYKLGQYRLAPDEHVTIEKKHPIKLMSTRTLYPGVHTLELQINGQSFGGKDFDIVE